MASATNNSNAILEHLEEGKSYDLEFGETWNTTTEANTSKHAYHTIKYDFKPASVLKSEQAELHVGATQDVSITIPNVEGSSTSSTKFSGNTKPYTPKECLMIIDPRTGKIVLERLSANVRVKNVRMENRSSNPSVKSSIPRSNLNDSSTEKKVSKTGVAQTTTTKTTHSNASTTQKGTNNPSKSTVNTSMKSLSHKPTLSPTDDRLSDEEFSPAPTDNNQSNPIGAASTSVIARRPSRTSLELDLQLSDTTDDEA